MLLELIDTTDGPDTIRRYTQTPDAVAGYGGDHNRFQNAGELFDAFPKSRHVLVVSDSRDHPARHPATVVVLDIEPGNSTPDIAGWIRVEQRKFGVARPPLYFALAQGVAVMHELHAGGINAPQGYKIWAARPNGRRELTPPGAFPGWVVLSDATQYLWSPHGINVDVSVCTPAFFDTTAPRPAPRPAPVPKPPKPAPRPHVKPPPLFAVLRRRAWNQGFQAGFPIGFDDGFGAGWKAHR